MTKRILLLTGSPGVGKTSVLLRTVDSLKAKGYSVGGMISREVRAGTGRVGFEIIDTKTDRRGWLAHAYQKAGPKVGRYRVNLEDLEGIGVEAIMTAVTGSDVIIIDEIGPMELCSLRFRDAVKKAVGSAKLVVGVVHFRGANGLVTEIKGRSDVEVHLVTLENRGTMDKLVFQEALDFLSGTA